MRRNRRKPPSYREKRVNGSIYAVTSLTDVETGERRDFYLGEYGSPASREAYARTLAEWEARGRRLPDAPARPATGITVAQLTAVYLEHVQPQPGVRSAISAWLKQHGSTPVEHFGPNALRVVRLAMATGEDSIARTTAGRYARHIVSIVKWGVAHELVEPLVWERLRSLEPLRPGTPGTRETTRVTPVELDQVEATLPHLGNVVADMVRVQLLTGMRPGEVMAMKPADVERIGEVWKYVVTNHKTAYRGHARIIPLGPKVQEIIRPFLDRDPGAFMFSPAEADAECRAAKTARRKTAASCGNRVGTNRKEKPRRRPADRYSADSYRRAIERACERAGIEQWSPNQLRHTYATLVRRSHGLEAAQVLLGHCSAKITDAVYAERDWRMAAEVALAIG